MSFHAATYSVLSCRYPSISRLYAPAAYCYIYECYYAAILVISSVIQLHLRLGLFTRVKRPRDWDEYWEQYLKYSTRKLIKMVLKKGNITPKLANKLDWFIKDIRHTLAHPDDELRVFSLDVLGLPRVDVGRWGE